MQSECHQEAVTGTADASTAIAEAAPASDGTAAAPAAAAPVQAQSCSDWLNLFRGFCMGAVDTVPGVSGGTVAMVLGHYYRLLRALSRWDTTALGLVQQRQWAQWWEYGDLRFLLTLAVGILLGAGSLATMVHWLLEHRMPETYAAFFGLVLVSGWIVAKDVQRWTLTTGLAAVAGFAFGYAIAAMPVGQATESYLYLFASAMIAICAMILPGISGAYVLLVLGMYHPVITMLKQFLHGDITVELILGLSVFAAGCLLGLATFTRFLRWLLRVHPNLTLAALVGMMLGSLRRIWPLQQATEATAELPFKEQQFRVVAMADWQGNLAILILLAVAGAVAVWGIERVAAGGEARRQT